MLDTVNNRRLLIVDPCVDCHGLLPGLRTVGWDVDSCDLQSALQHRCDVGLIRLQPFHLEHPEAVKELITRSGTEWIAVLNHDVLRMQNVGDFVCEWFFDFHTLPFDVSRVQITLGRAFGMARLRGQGAAAYPAPDDELLGDSHPLRELRKLIGKLAPTESPVLIRGESGTGKELVARTLHRQSQRASKPFVAINCDSVADHLLRSELFGYEKSALTGALQHKTGRLEAADGGTVFLDEVGALPLDVQGSLLHFLQERHIERLSGELPLKLDVRVLAATHLDLEAEVAAGRFREDLYYRLNVLEVLIAPLRERHGDLAMLANHFSHYYSGETGRRPRSFSEEALIAMSKHDWPGNVRELANRVRRGLVLAEGRQIEARDLGLVSQQDITLPMGTLEDYKHRAERQALCDVLNRHSDNLSTAAKVLGISRPTFYRLLHKHQIR
jgi:DNA-binding NtrC family response regulator